MKTFIVELERWVAEPLGPRFVQLVVDPRTSSTFSDARSDLTLYRTVTGFTV